MTLYTDRTRTTLTTVLTFLALLALVAAVFAPSASASADDPSENGEAVPTDEVEMNLQLHEFLSPGFGNEGADIPAYVGYSTQTQFEGPSETQRLDRRLVSQTIAVPRSDWSPGEGADEWGRALGFVFGPLSPNPRDAYADSFYLWTGAHEGALVGDGDVASHIKVWPTSYDAYQVPHTPTGEEGTFTWKHDPAWANVLHKTSVTNNRASVGDETVTSPVSTTSTGAMYVNQGILQVEGGDIDAADGGVAAPTFEFSQETPPGTVMNVQSVSYSRSGPWGDYVDLDIDFHTGIASGPTGEWRLPVDVTLEEGGFWPERSQPPGVAAPQYTLGLNAKAVPILPEEAEPGANELHLVSDLSPGESYVTILGLLQEDGSVETVRLELDEPGRRVWRVADGEVSEVTTDEGPPSIGSQGGMRAQVAPTDEAPSTDQPPSTDDASPDETAAAGSVAPTAQEERVFALEINEAGRPVVRNFTQDGTRLVDRVDTPRILTPEGPIVLDGENRDGRAVAWENPAGGQGRAGAAYHAGEVFVLVRYRATSTSLLTIVESHSLTGEPVPHEVETIASLDAITPVDRLSGEVTEATRFLPTDIQPRLTLPTPTDAFQLEPLGWDEGQVEIRNGQEPADGTTLSDPTYAAQIPGSEVWDFTFEPLQIVSRDAAAPRGGAFTSVQTYRALPELGLGSLTQGKFGGAGVDGAAIEPTRDFDGHEPIGIAFGAQDADGDPIAQDDVEELFLHLSTLDGETIFSGTAEEPSFTPDEGETWGVILYPSQDLDPADVVVYARATHTDGLVASEASPAVPHPDWQFQIDRLPLNVTSTGNAVIEGTTEPQATVTIELPEIRVAAETTADDEGTFTAPVDLAGVPGGDYEVVVHAIAPAPGEPKDIISSILLPLPGQPLPEDDRATTTARLHHVPGGTDSGLHSETTSIDRQAAIDFLIADEDEGVWGDALRPTAWAVQGLSESDAPTSQATLPYLDTLATDGGFAFHAGGTPSAVATGLAARTAAALGEDVSVDPTTFLRWDGSADAGAQRGVSSLEATAMLTIALDETGELEGLDPWWKAKITGYLESSEPTSPAETYAWTRALTVLGAAPTNEIAGDGLDGVAYGALTGTGTEADLAPYQLDTGGFTMTIDGDLPEALPTGLALAALEAVDG